MNNEELKHNDEQIEDVSFEEVNDEGEVSTRDTVQKLKEKIKNINPAEIDLESGKLPFVIVVKSEVIDAEAQMSRVEFFGKTGFTKLYPHVPGEFKVIESVRIPSTKIYLMVKKRIKLLQYKKSR
jgi:hypothetical protein